MGLTHLGDFTQALADDGGVEEVGAQGDRDPKLRKFVERSFDEHDLHVSAIGDPIIDRRQHATDVRWGNGHDKCVVAGAEVVERQIRAVGDSSELTCRAGPPSDPDQVGAASVDDRVRVKGCALSAADDADACHDRIVPRCAMCRRGGCSGRRIHRGYR